MTGALLLVGCGKMGGALLDGWLRAAMVARVLVVEPAGLPPSFQNRSEILHAPSIVEVPADFKPEVVVLAVKPQMMDAATVGLERFKAPGVVFLSIAAGKTIASFERVLGSDAAIVRAMPNTPAAIGRGMTVAVANPRVGEAERATCDALLGAVGETGWVEDEALIDAVTAVSGSGPAYVFHLVEAMAAAGVAIGLAPELSMKLARVTVSGSGESLRLSPDTAEDLRRAVTSPGGTTKAALDVLMGEGGLTPLMTKAITAAQRRSRELAG